MSEAREASLPFSTLKAGAPALAHPSKWHGVVTLTAEEFTYACVNTFSEKEAAAAYERYAVPETSTRPLHCRPSLIEESGHEP